MEFDIKKSVKSYIDSEEHYIVARNGVVYLRVIGSEGSYSVVTATAGEDFNAEVVCSDMKSLNESARKVSELLGIAPKHKFDFHGREYIEVCVCEYISDAHRIAQKLFDNLDS